MGLVAYSRRPLQGLRVFITHIKEFLIPHPSGMTARDLIRSQLEELEASSQLGVEFVIVSPGDRLCKLACVGLLTGSDIGCCVYVTLYGCDVSLYREVDFVSFWVPVCSWMVNRECGIRQEIKLELQLTRSKVALVLNMIQHKTAHSEFDQDRQMGGQERTDKVSSRRHRRDLLDIRESRTVHSTPQDAE